MNLSMLWNTLHNMRRSMRRNMRRNMCRNMRRNMRRIMRRIMRRGMRRVGNHIWGHYLILIPPTWGTSRGAWGTSRGACHAPRRMLRRMFKTLFWGSTSYFAVNISIVIHLIVCLLLL